VPRLGPRHEGDELEENGEAEDPEGGRMQGGRELAAPPGELGAERGGDDQRTEDAQRDPRPD
jgi:hypothetical protein